MARYATSTATEIRPQWDLNPLLTSTSQQVAGMRFTQGDLLITKPNRLPLLVLILYKRDIQLHSAFGKIP